MSRCTTGLIGATVAALTLGAATLQIASGHDLGNYKPSDAALRDGVSSIAYDVNRASKADRVTMVREDFEGPTIVFQHPSLPSTTIAAQVRQDLSSVEGNRNVAQQQVRDMKKPTAKRKMAAACERNVSVLTEVAKLLDAGRCIT